MEEKQWKYKLGAGKMPVITDFTSKLNLNKSLDIELEIQITNTAPQAV